MLYYTQTNYKKPSPWRRLLQAIKAFFSLTNIKWVISLFSFVLINHVRGRQLAKIGKSKIHPTAVIREGQFVSIGNNCLINHNCLIQAGKSSAGQITLKDYVHMGANVVILGFNHGFYTRDIPTKEQDYLDAPVLIEDDVWIGAGSII